MRAVKTVISAAGNLKRENPDMEEVFLFSYFCPLALLVIENIPNQSTSVQSKLVSCAVDFRVGKNACAGN